MKSRRDLMKVKSEYNYMDVYGVYWTDSGTCFLCLSSNNGGLTVYRADEVTVVDDTLSGEFVFFSSGIFYKPLITERLLDDIQEKDQKAFERFLEIIKKDGDKYESYLSLKKIPKWWTI
jgi:hypothetical protein